MNILPALFIYTVLWLLLGWCLWPLKVGRFYLAAACVAGLLWLVPSLA